MGTGVERGLKKKTKNTQYQIAEENKPTKKDRNKEQMKAAHTAAREALYQSYVA